MLGFLDERSVAFLMAIVMIAIVQIPVIVGEEVAAICEHNQGATWGALVRAFALAGFIPVYKILDSRLVLPQKRRRVYFGFINEGLPGAHMISQRGSKVS